nr:MAG TPA: hypothetical protein [Caudoviricetes sp.]
MFNRQWREQLALIQVSKKQTVYLLINYSSI